jgi:DNA-binding transcriptional regulator YiaG
VTLTPDTRNAPSDAVPGRPLRGAPPRPTSDDRPVEFWSTSAIHAALEQDDLAIWQSIVTAIKRDPYGRTARQVEEVLETANPYGVSRAMAEVLNRTRDRLEAGERAEVARHVHIMIERSGLSQREFASRIGVPNEDLSEYLEGTTSPSASLMIRIRRVSDRFAKMRDERGGSPG